MNSRIQKVPPPATPQARTWTSLDLINWTKAFFEKKGIESARLEAELLLASVLGCPRIRLYVDFEKPVPAEKLAIFREHVKRRGETREPLQYILGNTDFIDLKIAVSPAVLIPRPETEILALWAAEKVKAAGGETVALLDLCTGSGCLALYPASKEPRVRVTATDISSEALAVAAANAGTLKLDAQVAFAPGDLFGALKPEQKGAFDVIVSNPPYIDPAQRDTLQPEVRDHEPAQALFADEGGLAIIKRIIAGSPEWLKGGGWLGIEMGMGQADAAQKLIEATGSFEAIEVRSDNAKIPRFLIAQRKPSA
jgi:release factor glutamine methyltransferase